MTAIRIRPAQAICLAATLIVAGAVSTACRPSPDTGQASGQEGAAVSYLLVQTAPSLRYEDGSLVLESVDDMTLYFADRPARTAGWLTTREVTDGWGSGDDSFVSDPPNADLSILDGDESREIVVVLTNPRLRDDDLIYDVEVLEGEMPTEAGASSLFIDIIGNPLTPMSVAGMSRRTSRRTARRVSRRR